MSSILGCISTAHDLRLVALAGVICFVVSLLACCLFSFAVRAARGPRLMWLAAAAVAGGSGFWATHFVAMLSYQPGLLMGYDPAMVLAAWGVSVLGVGLAFLLLSMSTQVWLRLVSGVMFALAGAAMHYVAMAAFRTQGTISTDLRHVALSLVVGVATMLAVCAGVRRLYRWSDRLLGALAMTLSICAVHFIGMTAVHVTPDPRIVLNAGLIPPAYLAVSVTGTLLLAVSMATLAMLIHTRTNAGALSRLRDVIEAMPTALAYHDAQDRAVIWNRRYEEGSRRNGLALTPGLPYAQSVWASVRAGLYPSAVGQETEWVEAHLAARAENFESRAVERYRGGRWLRFDERRTRSGGIVSVSTDITDLKLSSERLAEALNRAEAADRVKTEFLSNLSHELRTPLNGVVGLTDVLASTELTAPQRQVVDAIFASAQSLTDLIASMLDFSDLQSGGTGLKAEPLDPGEMVQEAARLFAPAALAKGLRLNVDVRSRPGLQAVGDRARLRQVLISLLSNAVKFTEAGVVNITLDAEEGDLEHRLRFSVADTGIGFDGAQADRLFTQFEQGDGSMTRRFGGTGLGLAMSRQIAELMGAELTANSLPGHGATFTFTVALDSAPDAAPLQASPLGQTLVPEPASAGDEPPLRVLLADDHPTNRQVVELILAAADAAMTSVENGAEAVEAFQHGRYDLVLMDLQMPVMDGLTAMRAIRDYEISAHLPRTPMIALTANVLAEHVAASIAAGADRHMGKPITAARLLDEIGKVFERHTAANDVPQAA